MTPRKLALLAHRWVGLVLGLVMVLLGITGSILSFQREIDAALNPALFRPNGPPDPALNYAAIQKLAEAATGAPVGSLRPPDSVWPIWVAMPPRGARGALTAYLDPATGALLGQRDGRASFIGVTRQLHETLLLRDWGGHEAVGWLGVLLVAFALTGIWLWWPRGALLRALVEVRRRPALVLNLDLHRVVGIWMAVVLAVVGFSGVVIIFPAFFRSALGVAAPAAPGVASAPAAPGVASAPAAPGVVSAPAAPGMPAAPAGAGRREGGGLPRREAPLLLDADAAVAAALAHLPGQVATGVTLPSRQRPVYSVTLRPAAMSTEVRARSFVTIDGVSGAVLEERGPRTRGWAEEAIALQRWLHGGALLGWTGRLLVFASGIAMPVLFATGLAAWLLRRRNRRRSAAQRRQAVHADMRAASSAGE